MTITYEHATPEFEVKRFPESQPYLSMTCPVLGNQVLNACNSFLFHLRMDTTFKEAAQLQEMLEKYVDTVSGQGF